MRLNGTTLGSLLLVTACGGAAPQELVDARAAYAKSVAGPAKDLTPAQLYAAEKALRIAETVYEQEGNVEKTRDRAYVALRKVERAETQARIAQLEIDVAASERLMRERERHQRAVLRRELARAKEQLSAGQQELTRERQRRDGAETRERRALAELSGSAKVTEDARGVVITLPAEAFFSRGTSVLVNPADPRLAKIVDTLKGQSPDTTFLVEGHTEAPDEQELGTQRAQVVRDYLASHGMGADRFTTRAGEMGKARVEIVVRPGASPQ